MHKKRIHEMLEKLTEAAHSEVMSKSIEHLDTQEMGHVADIIKDLCEAEEKCYKACYYKTIVEAMKEEEEYEEHLLKQMIHEHGEVEGRMGYDRWRNSHGRFARTGHGHETSMAKATGRMGYDPDTAMHPMHDMQPWDVAGHAGVMGYPESDRIAGRPMGTWPGVDHTGTKTPSTHYDHYQTAKRHYHESRDPMHKREMTEHGKKHVEEVMTTIRDIFQDADPDMQQKMKTDLAALYREFGGK